MRAPNKGNHPLPVLLRDGGDYVGNCEFDIAVVGEPEKTGEGISLAYEYEIQVRIVCPPLENMISSGDAKIILMEEQETVRQPFDYTDGFKLSIPPYMLKLGKNVEITPMVVATKKTKLPFDPNYMDPIYGLFSQSSFDIENGQILGYGRTLEIETNQLRGLSSVIKIKPLNPEDPAKPFSLDLERNIIYVWTNKTIATKIQAVQATQPSLSHMVNAVICYPVIHMTIEAMISNPQKYSGYQWFVAIKNKINSIRSKRKENEFAPEDGFDSDHYGSISDYAWELTGELLTDSQGQMMTLAFERAAEYGG